MEPSGSAGGSSGSGGPAEPGSPTSGAASSAPPHDLFLSYAWGPLDAAGVSRPLQLKAHAVKDALVAAGYTVWLDTERMPVDAASAEAGLDAAMAAGISGAAATLVCFSEAYAVSANCRQEAGYAKKRRKPLLFVNVGEAPSAACPRGYDQDSFDDDDAEAVGRLAWLSILIGDALWADCRSAERLPSGVQQLLASLSGLPKLRKPTAPAGASSSSSSSGGSGSSGASAGASSSSSSSEGSGSGGSASPRSALQQLRLGTIPWSDVALLPSAEAPQLLGEGAFGRVYRGRWGGLSVAVKEILPSALPRDALAAYATNEQLLDCAHAPSPLQALILKFIREAEVMHQVNHPKVVRVYRLVLDVAGARAQPGRSPVAMVCDLMRCDAGQYVDLLQAAEERGCSGAAAHPAVRLQLALDLAEGLAYLHGQGMVHGDVKLANALVCDRGSCKLSDFGLARVLSSASATTLSNGASSVTAGRAGTVAFMAPELFVYDKGRDGFAAPSRSSDVFALGVALWELFSPSSRRAPYPGFNDVQVMRAVEAGKRPSLEDMEGELPEALLALMQACWAQERSARPKAAQAVAVLQGLARACPVPEEWAPPWGGAGATTSASSCAGGGASSPAAATPPPTSALAGAPTGTPPAAACAASTAPSSPAAAAAEPPPAETREGLPPVITIVSAYCGRPSLTEETSGAVPENAVDLTAKLAAALAQRGGAFLQYTLSPQDMLKGAGRLVVHYKVRSSSKDSALHWGMQKRLSCRGLAAHAPDAVRTAVVSLVRRSPEGGAADLILGPCYAPEVLVQGALQGTQHGTLVSAREALLAAPVATLLARVLCTYSDASLCIVGMVCTYAEPASAWGAQPPQPWSQGFYRAEKAGKLEGQRELPAVELAPEDEIVAVEAEFGTRTFGGFFSASRSVVCALRLSVLRGSGATEVLELPPPYKASAPRVFSEIYRRPAVAGAASSGGAGGAGTVPSGGSSGGLDQAVPPTRPAVPVLVGFACHVSTALYSLGVVTADMSTRVAASFRGPLETCDFFAPPAHACPIAPICQRFSQRNENAAGVAAAMCNLCGVDLSVWLGGDGLYHECSRGCTVRGGPAAGTRYAECSRCSLLTDVGTGSVAHHPERWQAMQWVVARIARGLACSVAASAAQVGGGASDGFRAWELLAVLEEARYKRSPLGSCKKSEGLFQHLRCLDQQARRQPNWAAALELVTPALLAVAAAAAAECVGGGEEALPLQPWVSAVLKEISRRISQGAPAYNSGDVAGCRDIYAEIFSASGVFRGDGARALTLFPLRAFAPPPSTASPFPAMQCTLSAQATLARFAHIAALARAAGAAAPTPAASANAAAWALRHSMDALTEELRTVADLGGARFAALCINDASSSNRYGAAYGTLPDGEGLLWLLLRGVHVEAEVDMEDGRGPLSALSRAAALGRSDMVQTLRAFGAQGVSVALGHALAGGHIKVVRELLEPLPPGTLQYEVSVPALTPPRASFSVAHPGSPAAYASACPDGKNSLLAQAVALGRVEAVAALRSAGAEMTAGRQPHVLLTACREGRVEVVEELLQPRGAQAGASANVCAEREVELDSCTASASGSGTGSGSARTRRVELTAVRSTSALMVAAFYGHVQCVQALLARGAEAGARDVAGRGVREYAKAGGHAAAVVALLGGGESI